MVKTKQKKNSLNRLRDFGSFRDAVFIPRASNKELSKIHLAFEREWQRHEVSVSIRLERQGHLRRSANGPASISWHNFQLLRWMVSSVDAVFFSNVNSKFTASAVGCSEETLFISPVSRHYRVYWEIAHAWRKTQNECSCLICDSSCCRTSCVLVYSRVHITFCQIRKRFCILAYFSWHVFVPALCQIMYMYSLSVCSDGTTSAAPRSSSEQTSSRTLSLTYRISCAYISIARKALVSKQYQFWSLKLPRSLSR